MWRSWMPSCMGVRARGGKETVMTRVSPEGDGERVRDLVGRHPADLLQVRDDPLVPTSPRLRHAPGAALDVAVREALHGLHQVLERATVAVRAAAALVVRERGERDDEDLVGAARGPRTLDEARRALRKWLDL